MVKRIYDKLKSTLFADPDLLFEEERDLVDKPFYFSGTNGKGVLLVHGWTSTPYEVRRLGKFLNENGYTVSGPMLRGHGTVPRNLENVRWQDWLEDSQREYAELKNQCGKVYVAGTSIGGNIALMLAKNNPDITGIVLMATPAKFKIEFLVKNLVKFLNVVGKRYRKKFYPPTFGVKDSVTRKISYSSYPTKSVLETFGLVEESRKNIENIKQPVLMMQSTSDHIVNKNSLRFIYANIGSTIKQKKWIKRAYHTFISDIKNEHVFEDILNFLNEN
ncbi:MAG: alpha/beta fold hydrolase [Parcubacteria group bacterium]|jgi:carboxylesterase